MEAYAMSGPDVSKLELSNPNRVENSYRCRFENYG